MAIKMSLLLICGLAWTITYIEAIRVGIRDKSYAARTLRHTTDICVHRRRGPPPHYTYDICDFVRPLRQGVGYTEPERPAALWVVGLLDVTSAGGGRSGSTCRSQGHGTVNEP